MRDRGCNFRTKSLTFFQILHLHWLDINIVLLNAKINLSWKKALLSLILSLVAIQFAPPGYACARRCCGETNAKCLVHTNDRSSDHSKSYDLWKMLVRMSKTSIISFTLFKRLRTNSILLWIDYQRPVESAPIFKISLSLEWLKHEYRLVPCKPPLITLQTHY